LCGASQPEKSLVDIPGQQTVSVVHYRSRNLHEPAVKLILGHGAGANQTSPFLVSFATELALRGIDVVTFNFLYSEQGRRVPDSPARLEACYQAIIAAVRPTSEHCKLAIGGKSMGGRIASQLAATSASDLAGLVLLGYPLHPPYKPAQVRAAHLAAIRMPMLFVQGSRDPFGTPEELMTVIKTLPTPTTQLHVVHDGDHSFRVRKRSGIAQTAVYKTMQDHVAAWLLGNTLEVPR
jgi:uncharacterized protein